MKACIAIPAGNGWTKLTDFPVVTGGPVRLLAEVGFCNGAAVDIAVGLVVSADGTAPAASDSTPASANFGVYEFKRVVGKAGLAGNGPLTRSLTVKAGQAVYVQASAAGVSATIGGMEI